MSNKKTIKLTNDEMDCLVSALYSHRVEVKAALKRQAYGSYDEAESKQELKLIRQLAKKFGRRI